MIYFNDPAGLKNLDTCVNSTITLNFWLREAIMYIKVFYSLILGVSNNNFCYNNCFLKLFSVTYN